MTTLGPIANQQYFKALTEASIVSKSSTDGTITYVNENFCKISGYTEKEMLGKSHNIFRHPDNPDSLYKEMWDTIQSGKIWRHRMTNIKKDGSFFIADTTIIPLVGMDGEILEYMAIRNDVTDLVLLKREIEAKEQEKAEQEKVKETQKAFLLLFTHELKTPLNAIINFSKYVKHQLEKPDQLNKEKLIALLDAVTTNADDMLENITMILETSKLKAGKLTYHFSLFDAAQIIQETLHKYHSLITEKKIDIHLVLEEDIWIKSDAYRFKQIFANILSNAIKYGGNTIAISLQMIDNRPNVVIEDNGPGIRDKQSVFDLYSQEDDFLLQKKEQGTGIGLYFIKLLCEDLHIQYKIMDGKNHSGTKFILIFDPNGNFGH